MSLEKYHKMGEVINNFLRPGTFPIAYKFIYDEKTQEAIEEGEWMKKCTECMESVIKTICGNG